MKLQIVSRKEADQIVSNPPADLTAVVSIFTPPNSRVAAWDNRHGKISTLPCEGFDEFPGHKIALSFDDAVLEGTNIFVPERPDIERFLKWAETVPYPAPGTILFHCHAGVSRSTACALAFLNLKHGPGSEAKCMDDVYAVRSVAHPNDLIVQLADDILGRGGKLLEAMQDWREAVKASGIIVP